MFIILEERTSSNFRVTGLLHVRVGLEEGDVFVTSATKNIHRTVILPVLWYGVTHSL